MKNMKKVIALSLLVLSGTAHAQRFDWATSGGYTGINNSFYGAIDLATDVQGNFYTMDVANGQQHCQGITAEPFSGYTTFIYKFDSFGVLEFINRVGAPDGGTFLAFNIETDEDGNLYLLGQPNGVNAVIVNNDTVPAAPNTNLLIRMDESGNYLWSVNTGFAGNGDGCMLQYHDGYLYYQSGNLSLSKVDTSGNVSDFSITASYYSSPTASQGIHFKGSTLLSNGDLVFAAYSRGTVAFGTDTLYHIGNPFLTAPVLLMRCDTALSLVWARYLSNARDPDQNFIPLATDADENIYTAVQVNDQMIIGPDTISNPENLFIGIGAVVKTDADGNGIWAKRIDNNGKALAWSMVRAENNSSVLIGGGFTGNAQIGPFTLSNGSNSKPFIATFNEEGTFTNAFNFLEEPTGTDVNCLAAAGNGNYLTGGKLQNFGSPELSCIPVESEAGFYLGRFSENPATVPVPTISITNMVLSANPPFAGEKQWYLNNSAIEGATEQSFTATEPGSYHVVYSYSTGCVGSAASDPVSFDPNAVENPLYSMFRVYPNPSTGVFFLKGLPEEGCTLELRNPEGGLLYRQKAQAGQTTINLSSYASGIYILTLISAADSRTLRLIRQ